MNNINSQSILYSKGKNDECYTPEYGVEPIIKYIPKNKVIWCPFDKEESNFVKILKKEGYKVIFSHIDNGQDFYNYIPEEKFDIIISNPPFTNKRKIFERVISFNKPFALLMSNTRLNDSAPKQLFKNKDLQLLMFDKRIEYNGNKKITFSSSYYCWDFLPKQIVMEIINKTKNINIDKIKEEEERLTNDDVKIGEIYNYIGDDGEEGETMYVVEYGGELCFTNIYRSDITPIKYYKKLNIVKKC